jgi:pyrroline-5-carboxylate reductase
MVTGLCSPDNAGYSILISPRNAERAADLARQFPEVIVAESNQQVLNSSEAVVVAVRPQIAGDVLAGLRFRPDHHVISLVSGYSVARLAQLVAPATKISRAVPLPSTARRRCPTAIFPADPVAHALFTVLGAAFDAATEHEFDAWCTTTAIMATYFAFAETAAAWLTRHGIGELSARDYIGRIFAGLAATAVEQPRRTFQELAADHATRGGTNEQILRHMNEHRVFETFNDALDGVMRRVTAASR